MSFTRSWLSQNELPGFMECNQGQRTTQKGHPIQPYQMARALAQRDAEKATTDAN